MVTAQVYNTTPSAIGSTLSLENTRARAASQSTPGLQFDGKNAKAVCGLLIAGLTVQLGRPFAPRSIERRLSKTMSFCTPATATPAAFKPTSKFTTAPATPATESMRRVTAVGGAGVGVGSGGPDDVTVTRSFTTGS